MDLAYNRDCPAWGNLTWPRVGEFNLANGGEVLSGFEQIERNEIAESVRSLATHEQVNVLQKVVYDDAITRRALDANQFAWVTKLPTGDYSEIQLTLSAQCAASPRWTQWFAKSTAVHLWNQDDRMKFVLRAAAEFDKMLHGKPAAAIAKSIQEIYLGRGVL